MKNLLRSIVLTSVIVVSIQAGSDPICAPSDRIISNLNQARYILFGDTPYTANIYFDSKTIKIDKKNKTVDVWVLYVSNAARRESIINDLGSQYQDQGLEKDFIRFLYTKNQFVLSEIIHYACDGNVISSSTYPRDQVHEISPNSLFEAFKDSLVKQFNLK